MKKSKLKKIGNIQTKKNSPLCFLKQYKKRIYKNLPVALIVVIYTGLMLFLSMKFHKIGGYEVETDFYADFIIHAKKLLEGDFSPNNFGLKGPVYYILLALSRLIFGEYFRAGLIMNVLVAGGSVWLILVILKRLFEIREAILTTLFSISTFAFLHYTYSVGTDMVTCFFSFLTIYFLIVAKRTPGKLVLAGLFACLAFLTRYNAVFLYPSGLLSIFLMDFQRQNRKMVLKNSGIFLGSSFLFGLPWYIPNMIVRGNPFYNENIIVMKLNYYRSQPEKVESITNIMDLILLDPLHFFKKTFANIAIYLRKDFLYLLDFRFSTLIIAGLFILIILLATKRIQFSSPQWSFFTFPFMHFAILLFAHYNVRFSFFRVPFYASLLFIPLMYLIKLSVKTFKGWRFRYIFFTLVLGLTLLKFYPGYKEIRAYHTIYNDPVFILDFAKIIKKFNFDESYGVITTKPQISYYSGLRMIMLPGKLKTIEELHEFAKEKRAKFLLMSYNEYKNRPNFRFLAHNTRKYPGFTPVYRTNAGILYITDVK